MFSKLFIGSLFASVALASSIHPNNNFVNKCLGVKGGVFADGTPIQIYDCNGTPAQQWFIHLGQTKVQLANTNFCLDAGSQPANFVGIKIWACFDNLPAQAWFYSSPARLGLSGTGLCLDLPNGNMTNGNQLQTYECINGNTNQAWTYGA